MYLPLVVSEPGNITFLQSEGAVLETGSVVATMQLADPTKVRKAEIFKGTLPDLAAPVLNDTKPHHILR
jgi:acetyl-CoA carboxylase/biotin carboxylase 1